MSSSTVGFNSMLGLFVIVATIVIPPASASEDLATAPHLRNLCGSPEYSVISHAGILSRSVGSADRRVLFFKALEACEGTEWKKRITARFCSRELTAQPQVPSFKVRFRRESPRKLMPPRTVEYSVNLWKDRIHSNYQDDPSVNPKQVLAATPIALLFCCAFFCPCFYSRKKKSPEQQDVELINANSLPASTSERVIFSPLRAPPSPSKFLPPRSKRSESIHLNLSQIMKATRNFSQSHVIGEGGFGTVYKVTFPDGQVFAVKRARKEHFEALKTEFRSEVDLLTNIEHRSLVKLIGYINQKNERLLISEYIPNGTLRDHLDCLHGKHLDFNQRLAIAIDVAHALTYLHMYSEKQVIHRDVKSSNILLTENLRAKVSDFGFARIISPDENETHIVTQVRGTAGYIDPEYTKTRKLTSKSDVYSFGVLLIEIFSGRRPVERRNPIEERVTIRWAFGKYTQGKMREILDPLLKEEIHGEVLRRLLGLAFECAAPTRADRPSMDIVAESLWAIRKDHGSADSHENDSV